VEWVYAALVIGCLVYSGGMVIDYTNYAGGIGPRIRGLQEGISDLDLEANAEAEMLIEVRKRMTDLRASVDDLRGKSMRMKDRLRNEKSRKQKLEMAVFKKRLKSRERW
jgi:hypothetical protein